MDIRQKRYSLDLKPRQKKFNIGLVVKIALIAAAVIAVIILAKYFYDLSQIRTSYLAGREEITVGVRCDVPAFGSEDEEGNITGFDRDISERIIRDIFGDEIIIKYVPLWSENAGAAVKYDQADIAVGFIVPGTDKASTFAVTDPYYYDRAVAVTNPGASAVLSGKRVGILNTEINVSTVEDYAKDQDIEIKDIIRYYDYESARNDLMSGAIDIFVMPYQLAKQYFGDKFEISSEELFDVPYCMLFPVGEGGIADVFSDDIKALKESGDMDNMTKKWGVSY